MPLFLTGDGRGYCLLEPRREYSARTRRLDRWVTVVGAGHPGCLSGDDAVHCDFQPANLLAGRGHITGVIDWDGAGRLGIRHFTAGDVDHWLDLAEQRTS